MLGSSICINKRAQGLILVSHFVGRSQLVCSSGFSHFLGSSLALHFSTFSSFPCGQFWNVTIILINKDESSFAPALISLRRLQLLGLSRTQVPNTSFLYFYVSLLHSQTKICYLDLNHVLLFRLLLMTRKAFHVQIDLIG